MDNRLRLSVEQLHLETAMGRGHYTRMHQLHREADGQWDADRLMLSEDRVVAGDGVAHLDQVPRLHVFDEDDCGDDTAVDPLVHAGFVRDQPYRGRLEARC